jgi:hypothetical protein
VELLANNYFVNELEDLEKVISLTKILGFKKMVCMAFLASLNIYDILKNVEEFFLPENKFNHKILIILKSFPTEFLRRSLKVNKYIQKVFEEFASKGSLITLSDIYLNSQSESDLKLLKLVLSFKYNYKVSRGILIKTLKEIGTEENLKVTLDIIDTLNSVGFHPRIKI